MRGVVKRWPRQPVPVLAGVDLDLHPGTVTCVAGRNGAGKTTLLRIAAGLLTPDEGTASVLGLDPERNRRDFQRHVGFLPGGNTGLYARLTVRSHLDFWSRMAFVPRARREGLIALAVRRFGLEALVERRVDRMSMGQRQRVRLAMTFLHEPSVVLLDEARSSLDEDGLALLVEALGELTRRRGAAVWCAPTGEELGMAPDRTFFVEEGRLRPA